VVAAVSSPPRNTICTDVMSIVYAVDQLLLQVEPSADVSKNSVPLDSRIRHHACVDELYVTLGPNEPTLCCVSDAPIVVWNSERIKKLFASRYTPIQNSLVPLAVVGDTLPNAYVPVRS